MKSNEVNQINEKKSQAGGLSLPPIYKGPHTQCFVKTKQNKA